MSGAGKRSSFLKKRSKKLFLQNMRPHHAQVTGDPAAADSLKNKSLFASFSSEKEDSSFLGAPS